MLYFSLQRKGGSGRASDDANESVGPAQTQLGECRTHFSSGNCWLHLHDRSGYCHHDNHTRISIKHGGAHQYTVLWCTTNIGIGIYASIL